LQFEWPVAVKDLLDKSRRRLSNAHKIGGFGGAGREFIEHSEAVYDVLECRGHIGALRFEADEEQGG
jgi:hypothetical protein